MALVTAVSINAVATLTRGTPNPVVPSAAPLNFNLLLNLASGVAAGQADLMWAQQRQVAASGTDDLDLTALTDELGQAVNFTRVKGLIVYALPGNTNNAVVGAAAANAWTSLLNATGTATLRPGGVLATFCGPADATGWVVTGAGQRVLRVTNSAGGSVINYQIAVIGASA